MDNKQKRKLLSSVYAALTIITVLAIGWVVYLATDKLLNKSGIMWLDIAVVSVCGLLLLFLLIDTYKTRRHKNKYKLAKYLFFIVFNSLIAVIVGGFVFYYQDIAISRGYIFAICLIFAVEMICIILFIIGLNISKLSSNTTITIDSTSQAPNFDDELYLKKKLNELNRKLEIKKVQEKIDSVQKELDGE
ncbi:MAG: hypothetical protein J6T74_06840 [Clostridia bacterium]|nr:hypothetical protein [Clostridia bacterium]